MDATVGCSGTLRIDEMMGNTCSRAGKRQRYVQWNFFDIVFKQAQRRTNRPWQAAKWPNGDPLGLEVLEVANIANSGWHAAVFDVLIHARRRRLSYETVSPYCFSAL